MGIAHARLVELSGHQPLTSSKTVDAHVGEPEQLDRVGSAGRLRAVACASLVVGPVLVGLSQDGPLMERLLTTEVLVWLTRLAAFALVTLALYYRWRTRHERSVAWLCACGMVCATFNTPLVLTAVVEPDNVEGIASASRPGLLLAACVLFTLVLARRGARGPWRLRPLQVGAAIGLAASGSQLAWNRWGADRWGTDLPLSLVSSPIVLTSGVAVGLLVAWCVLGVRGVPAWFRLSGAGVALGGTALLVLTEPGVADSVWRTEAWLLVDTMCCGALVFMGVRLLILTHTEQARLVEEMTARVRATEATLCADEEMLHELRATVAGIASASRLLRDDDGTLGPERAARLDAGIGREIDRIERRLRADAHGSARLVDLADTISPVVECARADGLEVLWDTEHVMVYSQPDHVAEAVHILLTNAQRHAAGSPVLITTLHNRSGMVELHVRDAGPGVAPEILSRLFVRGVHSRTSPGQGIGLHLASRLLADHGGAVLLAPKTDRCGAEFVVRLPAQEPTNGSVVPAPRRS